MECEHKTIQFENDFMSGYWTVRCQNCRLCTSWLPTREAASAEWLRIKELKMDIRKIVAQWLKDNGYEGLCKDGCGCEISDLMPCDEPGIVCEAGYKVSCPGPEDCWADGDCPWHICASKELKNEPQR